MAVCCVRTTAVTTCGQLRNVTYMATSVCAMTGFHLDYPVKLFCILRLTSTDN